MAGDDASGAAQAAHSLLFTLPDELLLNIAQWLPTQDQCELSRVSKHIGAIAQEALYRAPRIASRKGEGSRIAKLGVVLARNARLASKVQQLAHVKRVGINTTLFHPRDEVVAKRMRHLKVYMMKSQIVGYILKHVPNLRHLLLGVMTEESRRRTARMSMCLASTPNNGHGQEQQCQML